MGILESELRKATDLSGYVKLDQTTPQSVTGGTPSFYDIKIPRMSLGTPTYSTQNDFNNSFGSCGRKTGGAISDAGSNYIAVTAGTGFIKATDDDNAQLMFFDWPAPSNILIPSDSTRYIGVEYNGGSPRVVARTTFNWNLDSEFPLGRVISENINGAQELYIYNSPWWVTDGITNVIEVIRSFGLVRRDETIGGLIVSQTGTRNIAVSSGTLWSGLNEFSFSGLDTAVTGTFEYYWYKAGTGWQSSDATQYSVTQWNDVTKTTLQTISLNKFCNVWIYGEFDTGTPSVAVIYPQAQYNTAAAAEAVAAPTNLPTHIRDVGKLLGRIIIKQGVDAPVSVETVFTTTFANSVVTDHGNLSGLSDDDHLQYFRIDQTSIQKITGGLPDFVTGFYVGDHETSWENWKVYLTNSNHDLSFEGSYPWGVVKMSNLTVTNNFYCNNAIICDSATDAIVSADRGSNTLSREAAFDWSTAGVTKYRMGMLAADTGSDDYISLTGASGSTVLFKAQASTKKVWMYGPLDVSHIDTTGNVAGLVVTNNATIGGGNPANIFLKSPLSGNSNDRNWGLTTNWTEAGSLDLRISTAKNTDPSTSYFLFSKDKYIRIYDWMKIGENIFSSGYAYKDAGVNMTVGDVPCGMFVESNGTRTQILELGINSIHFTNRSTSYPGCVFHLDARGTYGRFHVYSYDNNGTEHECILIGENSNIALGGVSYGDGASPASCLVVRAGADSSIYNIDLYGSADFRMSTTDRNRIGVGNYNNGIGGSRSSALVFYGYDDDEIYGGQNVEAKWEIHNDMSQNNGQNFGLYDCVNSRYGFCIDESGYMDNPVGYKCGGTAPATDGTYASPSSITIQGGIVTAIS